MFGAAACAKLILSGEHAVVYGQPGIAFPFPELAVQANFTFVSQAQGMGVKTVLGDLSLQGPLEAAPSHPLALTIYQVLRQLGQNHYPDSELVISAGIPLGRGLGSGTALTAVVVRVLYQAFKQKLVPETLVETVQAIEKLYHGYPSGIDSQIISYGRPMLFYKGQPPQFLRIPTPFHFLVADTGISASTRKAVEAVRAGWQARPTSYERYFKMMGKITLAIQRALDQADKMEVGAQMNQNQHILAEIGVSHPRLEHLIAVARQAGAYGAKLSGAGQGGVCLALVSSEQADEIALTLRQAGAEAVYRTSLGGF